MAQYVNFYENLKEASMRIQNTVVLYDGEPYLVLALDDHKGDGVIRAYLDPLGNPEGMNIERFGGIPYAEYPDPEEPTGAKMDKWMAANPTATILRKKLNSPKFNRFRPFPIGMVNEGGMVKYVERAPTRNSLQGLHSNMLSSTNLVCTPSPSNFAGNDGVRLYGLGVYFAITNRYPSAKESLERLKDPACSNTGVAFHREFALIKGPCDLMFVGYRNDIIGFLPNGDLSQLRISKKMAFSKESAESLYTFGSVSVG